MESLDNGKVEGWSEEESMDILRGIRLHVEVGKLNDRAAT